MKIKRYIVILENDGSKTVIRKETRNELRQIIEEQKLIAVENSVHYYKRI